MRPIDVQPERDQDADSGPDAYATKKQKDKTIKLRPREIDGRVYQSRESYLPLRPAA